MNRAVPIFAYAVVLGGALVFAQSRQASVVTGSAAIQGVVLSDEANSRPVRRATITLTGDGLQSPLVAITDDAGRFMFRGLPAGTYTVMAARAAWVSAYFGGRQPGRGPGTPVAAVADQTRSIAIRMLPGAVISGTVRDDTGMPTPGARLQVFELHTIDGVPTLTMGTGGGAVTDDRGVYRAYGLAPGAYFVAVTRSAPTPYARRRIASGDEVAWADGTRAFTAPPPPAPFLVYAPVYYPGTADLSTAMPVTIGAGEERAGIDVQVRPVKVSRIAGSVTDADGRPASGVQVRLVPKTLQPDDFAQRVGAPQRSGQNGAFVFDTVPPGMYTLVALQAGAETHWAMRDVAVDGQDLSSMALTLAAAQSLSGRVKVAGTSAMLDLTKVRIGATSVKGNGTLMVSIPPVRVAADGSFALAGLLPGRYRFDVRIPDAAWTLASAIVDGREAADLPFDVSAGSNATGTLTFSNRLTDLTGTIVDPAGHPAFGFTIVVIPTDPRLLTAGGDRRVRAAHPANDGSYHVRGLAPGDYLVGAVTDFDLADLGDLGFVEQLRRAFTPLSFVEGESRVLNLRIAATQ